MTAQKDHFKDDTVRLLYEFSCSIYIDDDDDPNARATHNVSFEIGG